MCFEKCSSILSIRLERKRVKTYIVRRLLQMIPTLLGTSIIIFVLFALLPGDYIDSNPKITPERATELRELYGLNKPIVERYFHWLGNALQGTLASHFNIKSL